MGVEIERKFRVRTGRWQRPDAPGTAIRQGFLNTDANRNVRVRTAGGRGFLTIKGPVTGARRPEFEYRIPHEEARSLLALCKQPLIEKVRHRVRVAGTEWEIDVFSGENDGLVLAEVELTSEDQGFERPAWLGEEVTGDARFYNASLVANPYCDWPAENSH